MESLKVREQVKLQCHIAGTDPHLSHVHIHKTF